MLKVTPCVFPKANTCTRQSREFNTARYKFPMRGRNRAFQATNCLTEEGQKYAKLSKWLMQTQGKQQGRSVGSTKGEQIHAKGSQNPNRTSQVLQRNSECRLRVWRQPALISTAVQGS